jgi:hypothetical protein
VKYSSDQWAKCRWHFDTIPDGVNCYEHYPELADLFKPIIKAYAETDESVPLDLLIRYVVLTYHRYSPYSNNEQNIIKRKIDVCEFIGLEVTSTETLKVISNQNQFVNNSALYFLKQENMEWAELQQYLEAYFQVMGALTDNSVQDTTKTTQDIAKVKLAIVKDLKGIKSEIEQLSAKIFKEDVDLLNHVERYRRAEEESFVVLSPEQYVKSKRVSQ